MSPIIPQNVSTPPLQKPKLTRTKASSRNLAEMKEIKKESYDDLHHKSREAWKQWEQQQTKKTNAG